MSTAQQIATDRNKLQLAAGRVLELFIYAAIDHHRDVEGNIDIFPLDVYENSMHLAYPTSDDYKDENDEPYHYERIFSIAPAGKKMLGHIICGSDWWRKATHNEMYWNDVDATQIQTFNAQFAAYCAETHMVDPKSYTKAATKILWLLNVFADEIAPRIIWGAYKSVNGDLIAACMFTQQLVPIVGEDQQRLFEWATAIRPRKSAKVTPAAKKANTAKKQSKKPAADEKKPAAKKKATSDKKEKKKSAEEAPEKKRDEKSKKSSRKPQVEEPSDDAGSADESEHSASQESPSASQ